jgi:hypothetical protein
VVVVESVISVAPQGFVIEKPLPPALKPKFPIYLTMIFIKNNVIDNKY